MRAFSVVPPGQEGNVTALEIVSGDFGPHYSDQLEMYASLVDDRNFKGNEWARYFHSMQFGPRTVERDYSPIAGARVLRDGFGIPHIYADNFRKAGFALGYVSAEDRMFQMDVFRRAARGDLAEVLGRGEDDAYLEMDIQTRREGYTLAEIRRMFRRLDERFGRAGRRVQVGLRAYADGINR